VKSFGMGSMNWKEDFVIDLLARMVWKDGI